MAVWITPTKSEGECGIKFTDLQLKVSVTQKLITTSTPCAELLAISFL